MYATSQVLDEELAKLETPTVPQTLANLYTKNDQTVPASTSANHVLKGTLNVLNNLFELTCTIYNFMYVYISV